MSSSGPSRIVYIVDGDASVREGLARLMDAAGLEPRPCVSVEEFLTMVQKEPSSCVLLDLHNPGLDIESTVRQLKKLTSPPFVVGYGSHVDAPTLKRARDAGCDLVLPRSKFVEELRSKLPDWIGAG